MAVEFTCPECSQLVRTPDEAAGKKGRCPFCSAVVHIPSPYPMDPGPGRAAESGDPSASDTSDKISFECSCGKILSASADMVGNKARCPRCGTMSRVPPESTAVPPSPPVVKPGPALTPEDLQPKSFKPREERRKRSGFRTMPEPTRGVPSHTTIEFPCSYCEKLVRTPASAAGKKGRCPHCNAVVLIPRESPIIEATDLLEELPDEDVPPTLQPLFPDLMEDLTTTPPIVADPPPGGGSSASRPEPLSPLAMVQSTPASPARPAPGRRAQTSKAWVIIPAVVLILYALPNMFGVIVFTAVSGWDIKQGRMPRFSAPPEEPLPVSQPAAFLIVAVIAFTAFSIFVIILAGAVHMLKYEDWGLSLTACMLALLPCNIFCCWITFPIGVWGIIALSLPDVRRSFI